MAEQKKPVMKFRLRGLQLPIWENEATKTEQKGTFYTLGSITRSYKVGEDWKSTPTLRVSDIRPAQRLLQKAEEWIEKIQEGDGQ